MKASTHSSNLVTNVAAITSLADTTSRSSENTGTILSDGHGSAGGASAMELLKTPGKQ